MPAQPEPIESPTLRAFAVALTGMRGKNPKNGLAELLGYTPQYIGQIEAFKNYPSRKFAEDLDTFFGTEKMFADLWELLDENRDEVHLPPGFTDYVEREAHASLMYVFEFGVVKGIFQTRDYAHEVLKAGRTADETEQLVARRMDRQRLLAREAPPRIVAVFDEGVIRRVVGNPEIMKAQLTRLIELAEMPNVTFHIVAASKGAYPGLPGAFTILRFDDEADMVYTEGHVGGNLTDHTATVREHTVRFDLIRGVAMSADESLELLRTVLESL